MTVDDSMSVIYAMQQQKLEQIASWVQAGKMHVSPAEAASVLDMRNPYGLNIAAREGVFPRNAYFFSGRNMRIMVSYLADVVRGAAS
jgi:hypothetical protein